jgi:hypothetical protein
VFGNVSRRRGAPDDDVLLAILEPARITGVYDAIATSAKSGECSPMCLELLLAAAKP